MIKIATQKVTSARIVGWVELQLACGQLEKVGNIYRRDDGTSELSLSCIPLSGILELHFNSPDAEGKTPLLMKMDNKHCDIENIIGHVEVHGASGRAIFSAYPTMDARFTFGL